MNIVGHHKNLWGASLLANAVCQLVWMWLT